MVRLLTTLYSILSNPTPDYLFERLSFNSEIRANNATRIAKLYQFKRKSCTTLHITWPLMIHTCIHLYVLVSSFVMLAQVNFTWIISTIEDLLCVNFKLAWPLKNFISSDIFVFWHYFGLFILHGKEKGWDNPPGPLLDV